MKTTVERVPAFTSPKAGLSIQNRSQASIAYYSTHPHEIEQRLRELDAEWDIERAIEVEAAGTVLAGLVLGTFGSRKWLVLPLLAGSMLLVHNLHGFYPLIPLLRRMGFRTQEEIAAERYALKHARGDFEAFATTTDTTQRLDRAFFAADPHS